MKYLALIALILVPSALWAYGPGVHIREAERTLALLEEVEPDWAQPASEETAISYLRLGSIAPDFQWASEELNFGHAKELSYALLEAAKEMPPQYRVFALGHLAHISSDASSEVFFAPTIFASAPLGPFDLFVGDDNAKAETEAICEGYGDFILGDWNAVVDLLFDFHRDGVEADAAFSEIFLWYCSVGKEHHETDTDCEGALAEIQGLLASADAFIEGLDRDGAKILVGTLIDQPHEGLYELYTGGLLEDFIGGQFALSENLEYFEGLFLSSALVTDELWALYEEAFVNLGPRLTLDHLALQPSGWPEYDGVSLISGNIQSMLQFLPDDYTPKPFLRLNELNWLDSEGLPITSVDENDEGKELSVEMVLHSSMFYTGTITAMVRRDLPGFSGDEDDIVGTASVEVDINPELYSQESRTTLAVTFMADSEGALGYYVELGTDDADLPWMTTSWDRIWTIEALDMSQAIYRNHFGTYGHWPPSLPVANADGATAALAARAFVHPAGPGIQGVTAHLEPDGVEAVTGNNGLAFFDALDPGDYQMTYSKEGYISAQSEKSVETQALGWTEAAMQPIPRPFPPSLSWGDPNCIPFTWNVNKFGGQTDHFFAVLNQAESGETLSSSNDVGNTGEGELCATETLVHGTPVLIRLHAVYVDGLEGFAAPSDPFYIDTAPPSIYEVNVTQADPPACNEDFDAPMIPAMDVAIRSLAVPPGIQSLRWRLSPEASWEEETDFTLEYSEEIDGSWLHFSIDGQTDLAEEAEVSLEVELVVTSGESATITPQDIAIADPAVVCAPASTDETPEEGGDESVNDDGETENRSGGCQTAQPSRPWLSFLLFLFILWIPRRVHSTD